jgi:amidase
MGAPGGDRTTVELAALLTEVVGGYRIPPQQRSSVMSTA